MGKHILGLDHVIVAVSDLDQAMDCFRRLGFTVTPKGAHPQWGTANACVMFQDDYIELLAPQALGPESDRLRDHLDRRGPGLFALFLGCDNAEAAVEELNRSGVDVPPATALTRRVESPDGPLEARFRVTQLPASATPGVACRLVQHLDGAALRPAPWLAHANSATGLVSVSGIVEDPVALTGLWDRVFGTHNAVLTDDLVTIHPGRGLIFLAKPDDISQLHPDIDEDLLPPPPALIALTVRVADTDSAAQSLRDRGVPFSRDREGTIRIDPDDACGIALELVAA